MAEIYIRTDSSSGVITFIHRRPFDPVHGLGETRDILSKTGFFITDFPDPVMKTGYKAIAHYDHEKKSVYYEYLPVQNTEKSRLDMLEGALNDMLMGTNNQVSTMSLNETQKETSNMRDGLARYLAAQIFQGKLDHDIVLNTYPELKDDIESFLNEMDVIPVIPSTEEE